MLKNSEGFVDEEVPEMEAVVEGSNKFAVDLHKVLKNEQNFAGKNLFYSPGSLSIALAMTTLGARGNTAIQLARVLHWRALPTLHDEERRFVEALQASNTASNELLTANRIFLQEDFNILPGFMEEMKKFYDAEVGKVDYQDDTENARLKVNAWVEEKTKQKIQNMIPEGVFNTRTRLSLVNAIYFKGFWQNQFDKKATCKQSFVVSKSEKTEVEMMHLTKKFKYAENGRELPCQILELPYQGEDLSMFILLPHDTHGLAELEESISHEKLQRALAAVSQSHPVQVDVSLPSFKLTQQFQLKEILIKLGLTDMFSEFKSDFKGILRGPERLYVSHVVHKAFVEVNEKGTEAAAATAVVVMSRMAVPDENATFCADHPFLFMICHKKSRAILFMGRFVKPE